MAHRRRVRQTHLDTELVAVEKLGGEGLMLREPKSIYAHGRSHQLLKVKSFHDEEGTVVLRLFYGCSAVVLRLFCGCSAVVLICFTCLATTVGAVLRALDGVHGTYRTAI